MFLYVWNHLIMFYLTLSQFELCVAIQRILTNKLHMINLGSSTQAEKFENTSTQAMFFK